MKHARTAVLVVIAATLAACGALPAPPGDTFYRLHPVARTGAHTATAASTAVFVPPFSASGLHAERALLYAHEDGTTLEQYSYHLWIDSPRYLLQQSLGAALEAAFGVTVITEPAANKGRVQGRIVQLERRAGSSGDLAAVSLHFDVYPPNGRVPILSRTYESLSKVESDDIAAYVLATDVAVDELFRRLTADLAEVW